MKRVIYFVLVLAVTFTITNCSKSPTGPTNREVRELTSIEKNLVQSDNSFGLKVFQEIIKSDKDQNVFISPLSISMALGMTLNGANGATKDAMQSALELAGLSDQQVNENYKSLIDLLDGLDQKVKFQIANSIWYRNILTFEQPFLDVNKNYFNAEVSGLDFSNPQSKNIINAWVEDNTNGKIKQIVDNIDPLSVMFLINAIYFKGTWTYEFEKNKTQDGVFNLPDGSQVPCKMMVQAGEFSYLANDDFQAVDLPYGDELFSMTVILPQQGKDIDALMETLSAENWNDWFDNISQSEGELYFPRFGLDYEITLNDVLKAMGMEIAFSPSQADFTRMYKNGGLYIYEVKHKSFIEVNEEGTEAAAATVVDMRLTSVGSGFTMQVDRPFIFAIREKHSGTILFIGKITNPS
jgi:serine protease inhibitor